MKLFRRITDFNRKRMRYYGDVPLSAKAVLPTKHPYMSTTNHTKIKSGSRHDMSDDGTPSKPDDLQTIKQELTQIKAQVDGLLESLEKMEERQKSEAGRRN
ncbi:RNA-binding Raly-like protein [Protopterus annectens]|uniref:RNA-binding Raly-like protein n=1 Tax=Protopterus annectens TaxID=7888 RepID=UPI001CF98F83|nr:RNA-binding Raly-like protein [Protopterus annectens]